MRNDFVRKAISPELSLQIDEMIKRVKESFNIDINKIQSSKVVAWKNRTCTAILNEKKLIEILGGKI